MAGCVGSPAAIAAAASAIAAPSDDPRELTAGDPAAVAAAAASSAASSGMEARSARRLASCSRCLARVSGSGVMAGLGASRRRAL